MGERKRVYLHIGGFKTGSTFLQRALRDNAGRLAAEGYLLPTKRRALQRDCHNLAWEVTGNRRFDPGALTLERLRRRLEGAPERRVLISSEFFSLARSAAIDRLVAGLGEVDLQVVLVVRNQVDAIQSLYAEAVSHGRFAAKSHFLARQLRDPVRLRFDLMQRRWAERLGAERVRLICYETARGDLLRAFLETCDLALGEADWQGLVRPAAANLSGSFAQVELRRWHNAALAELPLAHRELLEFFAGPLSRSLAGQGRSGGGGSYLTAQEAALVADYFAPHNAALRELLPELPASYFEPPPLAGPEPLPDQQAVARAYVGALDALIDRVPLLRSRLGERALLRLLGGRSRRERPAREQPYEGAIERIRPRRVQGWALRPAQDEPLHLELRVEGERLADIRAELPRRQGPGAPPACGFRFVLEGRRLRPGERITIADSASGATVLTAVVPEGARGQRRARAENAGAEEKDDPGRPGLHHP